MVVAVKIGFLLPSERLALAVLVVSVIFVLRFFIANALHASTEEVIVDGVLLSSTLKPSPSFDCFVALLFDIFLPQIDIQLQRQDFLVQKVGLGLGFRLAETSCLINVAAEFASHPLSLYLILLQLHLLL